MKNNQIFRLSSAVLLCLAFSICGCDKTPKPDGLPDLSPLTIAVTQDGSPLAEASVCLNPVSGTWNAIGKTDATGKVALYTQGRYVGVAEGTYKVTVVKDDTDSSGTPSEASNDPNVFAPAQAFSLVEIQYRDIETTPLTLQVSKGQKTATVDVGKAVREKLPELK